MTGRAFEGLKLARFPRREEAACIGMGIDVFFVERGEDVYEAKAVCRRCDIRPECLRYAVENDIQEGVFGGKSPKERREWRWMR